jgi:hypothetical protein
MVNLAEESARAAMALGFLILTVASVAKIAIDFRLAKAPSTIGRSKAGSPQMNHPLVMQVSIDAVMFDAGQPQSALEGFLYLRSAHKAGCQVSERFRRPLCAKLASTPQGRAQWHVVKTPIFGFWKRDVSTPEIVTPSHSLTDASPDIRCTRQSSRTSIHARNPQVTQTGLASLGGLINTF